MTNNRFDALATVNLPDYPLDQMEGPAYSRLVEEMLQAPESGGEFEIVPNIRSDEDPNAEALSRVLLGDRSKVVSLERREGALVIFRGCHSAHRVTMVEGERLRQMCVMVYELEPGVIGDPVVNETVYGIVRR